MCLADRDADIAAITHGCGTQLTCLQLGGCLQLTSSAVRSIGHTCPQLQLLDLSGCWGVRGLEPLASCTGLRSVLVWNGVRRQRQGEFPSCASVDRHSSRSGLEWREAAKAGGVSFLC